MKVHQKPRFKRVYVEITNVCNLRCPFCTQTARAPRFMTREEFARVARELRPYTDYLYFHLKGEPLLHPQLLELLDVAGELGFRVNLTTNGVLLPQMGPFLWEHSALRQVNISLHSYTEVHGEMEAYVAAVAAVARRGAQKGGYTSFRIWTMDRAGGMDETAARLLEMLTKEFPKAQGWKTAEKGRSIPLGEGIFLSFDQEFRWPSLAEPEIAHTGTCYGTRTMAGVLVDGTVVPCCLDGEGECPLGNLYTQPMVEILASPKLTQMREGFAQGKITQELCQRCDYRTRFDPR